MCDRVLPRGGTVAYEARLPAAVARGETCPRHGGRAVEGNKLAMPALFSVDGCHYRHSICFADPALLFFAMLIMQVTSQGRGELLDGDEEKELTLMVQDLLKLEAIATELKVSLGRTPTDQEWMEGVGMGDERRFAARVHQGRKAKTMMVQSNLRLVVSICKKYTGYGLSLQDLVAEGIAGLLKGVERFEPTKGFKFSTYAHWWIRQSITRGLSDQGRMVRLPVHMHELLQKVMKAQRSLSEVYGRKPRMEEVSAHLGVEIERIHEMYEVMRDTSSLDQPMMDGDGAATLGDTVEVRRGAS